MFNAPGSSMPPRGAYPPPPSPPSQPGGEFTGMFGARDPGRPAPPPSSSSPTPPKKDESSEFTRMFNSPLEPAPLKAVQGPPDPFGGRPNVPQPQTAPAGEFTQMFGRHEGPPPPAPAMGTPTPRPPSSAGATSVFQTPGPQAGGGAPARFGGDIGFGQQPQGPPPSVGAGNFTSIMSTPSEGILARAAAETAPAKKGFFKTYWPLILVIAILVIAMVVILIVFSKKH
jgi:hypothetical protein